MAWVPVLNCRLAGHRVALREAWLMQFAWLGLKKLRFSDWERRNRSRPIEGAGGRADTIVCLLFGSETDALLERAVGAEGNAAWLHIGDHFVIWL